MTTTPRPGDESPALVVGKAVVLSVAAVVFSWTLAGGEAITAGVVGVCLATLAARLAGARRLRVSIGVMVGLAVFVAGFVVSEWVLDTHLLPASLDGRTTLIVSDIMLLGLCAFGLVFVTRLAAGRYHGVSILEAAMVIAAVAHLFARHRNQTFNRPRFLMDWALVNGLDPQILLMAFGVVAAAVATLMALRRQRVSKLVLSLMALLLIAVGVYYVIHDQRIEVEAKTPLGLTKAEQQQQQNQDGNSGESPPPSPVALALFHEDFSPPNDALYFRQQVQSQFDGTRLVTDSAQRFDTDVITTFPLDGPIEAATTQHASFFQRVPTSMFLMVDHPQPLALSASTVISPRPNPAPQRFVAAYDAMSLAMEVPFDRLVGRSSVPSSWSPERRAYYLSYADDPRYQALADQIVRELDPRFASDDVMKALAIKRWLEVEGYYTMKERHANTPDPAADFLFGNLRGYCVHFAHAAANLFRSQGIAARVAVGYMVDNRMRGGGSAVLILGDRAHAWPEIHLEGVGWIPFDIYPERSDAPPPQFVDMSLESLLGEMARGDPTGGLGDPDTKPFEVPWMAMVLAVGWGLLGLLLLAYGVKFTRMLAPRADDHRRRFRAALDRLSDGGFPRRIGETRERYAARMAPDVPSLVPLTHAHLRLTLGRPRPVDTDSVDSLSRAVVSEFGASRKPWQRALIWLNPLGWWFTR